MTETGTPAGGLLCPHCRVDLTMSERQGVEIDYCPKCRGVWLDRGELDKIIERSAAYEARLRQDPQEDSARGPERTGGGDGGGRFLPEAVASPWGTPPASAPQPPCPHPEPLPSPGWPAQPYSQHPPAYPNQHAGHGTTHGHGKHHGQEHGGHRGSFLGRFFD